MLRKIIGLLILIILLVIIFHGVEYLLTKEPKREPTYEEILEKGRKELRRDIPFLIKRLNAPREMTREIAIRALAQSEDPRAIEPLAKVMLEDKVPLLRKFAAECLSTFPDKRIVPIFKKQVLENGPYKIIGATVLMKLGSKEEKELALPILEKYAEEGHPEVLYYDEFFLRGKTVDSKRVYYNKEKARIILKKLLNHKDEEVRADATYYLFVEMGEKENAISRIDEMINSRNFKARHTAVVILELIGNEKSKRELLESERKIYDKYEKKLFEVKDKLYK